MKPTRLSTNNGSIRQKEEELLLLDNAIDRLVAAVLVAGSAEPSLLLGPIGIWLGERGVARHSIDGRLREPGKGLDRPRGHVERAPDAAFVAISALPSSLAAAHALYGKRTLREVGAVAAKAGKNPLVESIRDRAGQAYTDKVVVEAHREAAGPLVGGLFSEEDVRAFTLEATPIAESARKTDWPEPVRSLEWSAVATSDARGHIAFAVFGWDSDGVLLPSLHVRAPRVAVPVLRGVERTRPGTLLDGLPNVHWSDNGSTIAFVVDLPGSKAELKVSLE